MFQCAAWLIRYCHSAEYQQLPLFGAQLAPLAGQDALETFKGKQIVWDCAYRHRQSWDTQCLGERARLGRKLRAFLFVLVIRCNIYAHVRVCETRALHWVYAHRYCVVGRSNKQGTLQETLYSRSRLPGVDPVLRRRW
jgi:hypothetical protein